MKNKLKKTANALLVFYIATQGSFALANDNKTQEPITVTADELKYNETTGDVKANGKVQLEQQDKKLNTELLTGNIKTGDMKAKDESTFIDLQARLIGKEVVYNFKTKQGNMQSFSGKIQKEYVKGQQVTIEPQEYIVEKGYTTRCSLDDPDYKIVADKIEVFPDDNKLIAYNAKFMIGSMTLYSLPRYEATLSRDNQDENPFPKVGYFNEDGFYVKQHLSHSIAPNVNLFADIGYYTKSGYRPDFGIAYSPTEYSFKVIAGKYRDGDGNWIKKMPEYNFALKPQRIGQSPVQYRFTAIYGKWIDSTKESWHQDYSLYFTRDTIILNPTLSLDLGAGIEKTFESYDRSQTTNYRVDSTLTKKWSDRLTTYTGYHYRKTVDNLFSFNNDDLAKELDLGFSYKLDQKNVFSVSQSYDLEKDKTHDLDYTITHDMHCSQASVTYRAKREQWKFDITMTKW